MRTFLITLCVTALGASGASAQQLTGIQLQKVLAGHRVVWKSYDGSASGVTTYESDGTLVAEVDGDKKTYKGTWRIHGAKMCEKLDKEVCAAVTSLGGNKYVKSGAAMIVE